MAHSERIRQDTLERARILIHPTKYEFPNENGRKSCGNCLEEPKSHRNDQRGRRKEPRLSCFSVRIGGKVGDELDLRRLGHCDASERVSDAAGLPVAATTTSQTCLLELWDLCNNRDSVRNPTRIPNDVMVP